MKKTITAPRTTKQLNQIIAEAKTFWDNFDSELYKRYLIARFVK